MIKSLARISGGNNFDEAIQHATECFKTDALPFNLSNLFEKLNDEQKTTFWVCSAALKAFFEVEKRLPLAGSLPDMVSTTDYYLNIQRIYIDQAEKDKAKMKVLVGEILTKRKIDHSSFDCGEFDLFCKNCAHIEVL